MNQMIKQSVLWGVFSIAAACSGIKDETSFETIAVKRRNISSSIQATGIVRPKTGAEVKVGSRVSGVVKDLFVKNGDTVKKGDLLATLEDSELSARYRLELANLENAQTILKYARIEMDRVQLLAEKDFASAQSYDNLKKEYDLAVSRVGSQQAQMDYSSAQLGFTRIYAPISGVIASVSTQKGETVSASFVSPTFVTIINLSRIEIWTYVDETDIGKVSAGQKATFTVDTYAGTMFEGKVTAIYPKAEIRDNVVNYVVILEIEDAQGVQLRPEMTTYVTVMTQTVENALSVPDNVIRRVDGEPVVYVMQDNRPVLRKIKTGIKGNHMTEVKEGLNENEQVIINSEKINP
jgi:RND family efflux transporter MFP subunit